MDSNDAVARRLHDVALAYNRFTQVASRQRGMAVTDLLALSYLRDEGPLTPKRLGELLGLTSGSMTPLLDRLDRAGFARRIAHPSDRRSLLIELTEAGRQQVGTLFELLASDVTAALDGMLPAERDAVARFLGAIAASFEGRVQGAS